jgi:hypothetical protein
MDSIVPRRAPQSLFFIVREGPIGCGRRVIDGDKLWKMIRVFVRYSTFSKPMGSQSGAGSFYI